MRRAFIQLAFNHTLDHFYQVVKQIPQHDKIILEAGTPLIKREGIKAVSAMRRFWPGAICADLKTADGAVGEVLMAKQAGATMATVLGTSGKETLRLFIETCRQEQIVSVVDMIHNDNPMKTLWKANLTPDRVFIHRGRDEENSFGKIIQYKEIAKIKGKWDIQVGAAGGIDKKELQSAIFNNADIVVVNLVQAEDPWKGIVYDKDFVRQLQEFLKFI